MGYTTEFKGKFSLDQKLDKKHFASTRRMKRNPDLLNSLPTPGATLPLERKNARNPLHLEVGLEAGPEGAYFVDGSDWAGQGGDDSILDYNKPPAGQPGLWCQWVPNRTSDAIVWDKSEKFYNYVEWIQYLIKHFLQPWGYILNGKVTYQGEAEGDKGYINIVNNSVTVFGKSTPTEIKKALKTLHERFPNYGFDVIASAEVKNHYCIHAIKGKNAEDPKYGISAGTIPVIEIEVD